VDFYINFTLATMVGKGRDGTYIFSHVDWVGGSRGQGIGNRGQLPPATPLATPVFKDTKRLALYSHCIPNSKVDNAPIWAPVLSLQLVSAFLCQLVPLQFYLMRGLLFYITSIFYTFIIAVLTTLFWCMYIYCTFLLCVLLRQQALRKGTG